MESPQTTKRKFACTECDFGPEDDCLPAYMSEVIEQSWCQIAIKDQDGKFNPGWVYPCTSKKGPEGCKRMLDFLRANEKKLLEEKAA